MSERKFQIFVSSTFVDLQEERRAAIESILDGDHIPAGMELFPAADQEQFDYIKKVIDQSDFYVLIIGARYGSTDEEGVSFTEREYDYALEMGKEVLAFLHGEPDSIPQGNTDKDAEKARALEAFRNKAKLGRLVQSFANSDELKYKIGNAINKTAKRTSQPGWVRGDQAASTEMVTENNRLLKENARLKEELAKQRGPDLPEIEGLAGLEDRYEFSARGLPSHGPPKPLNIKVRWMDVFTAVAAGLQPYGIDADPFKSAFLHLVKLHGKDYPSYDGDFSVPVIATFKTQLEALGLICFEPVSGGGSARAALTPKGRAVFLANQAQRKPGDVVS